MQGGALQLQGGACNAMVPAICACTAIARWSLRCNAILRMVMLPTGPSATTRYNDLAMNAVGHDTIGWSGDPLM